MKVAIVHDWFVGWGAEQVVYELHKMYPEAPIYTSYCNDEWRRRLQPAQVITSYMQHWPLSKLRKFLPILRAIWFSRLDLSGYDLVISSSGAEAKGIKVRKPTIHINYCHAPTHYYWSRYEQYMKQPGFGVLDPLARLGLGLLVGPMRQWDLRAAGRPDYYLANSTHTQQQIQKYYHRSSTVIHPPVEVEKFKPAVAYEREGFLIAGRQTPYKRFDLAVAACTKLSLNLKVLGGGPDHKRLVKLAGPTITFIPSPASQKQMAEHFQKAEAFIFPGLDDFGIVAVEAMAAGTPVIAYGKGGALDYINMNTGIFFSEPTSSSLEQALTRFSKMKFNHEQISRSATASFSASFFQAKILGFIKSKVEIKQETISEG